MQTQDLHITYVPITKLNASDYNPRKWDEDAKEHLKESIERFGVVDPIIVNKAKNRQNIVIGGHFRLAMLKELGHKTVPVVYVHITDITKEKELNLRLNKNQGEFDFDLLKQFDTSLLTDIGFTSEELDDIFLEDEEPEMFDLQKELEKLNITKIEIQKGDIFEIDGSRLMCGDSTVETDMLTLMNDQKADMCFTDPPYILAYLDPKKKQGTTSGF